MLALYYLLGFLSGIAAAVVAALIIAAKKRKGEASSNIENSFTDILNY